MLDELENLRPIYQTVWEQTHSPIAVIKALREAQNLSLAEAKDAFDRIHYGEGEAYQQRQRQIEAMVEAALRLADEEKK